MHTANMIMTPHTKNNESNESGIVLIFFLLRSTLPASCLSASYGPKPHAYGGMSLPRLRGEMWFTATSATSDRVSSRPPRL